ncbi:hypothetical protein [Bradyrhizobium roseum]|uniref:hypothetical protein n=1 Tax=Bradyrhizobium roseum TaxID=3056648 RepID=UPI00262AA597|nr:hypothetical protein [Bradyrhizobium roseus]WKA27852.1 hypothetical protein QUH67_30525 [Bradyrhizobium roseus]
MPAAHDDPNTPGLASYPGLELSLIIAWADFPSGAPEWIKFRTSGGRRQTNCRMGGFQPAGLPAATVVAVNKLFFSGNFREDWQGNSNAPPINEVARGGF